MAFVIALLFTLARSDSNTRFDCYPDANPTQQSCEARGCIWAGCDANSPSNCPSCYYPNDFGYSLSSTKDTSNGVECILEQYKYSNPYGYDIKSVKLDIIYETQNRLHLKYTDLNDNNRYQVPIKLPEIPINKATNVAYNVTQTINNNIFGLNISYNNIPILTTNIPGFMYSDQFIQILFGFNDNNIASYGFGERYANIKVPYNKWTTWPLFSRDIGDDDNNYRNSYGVHPFLLNILSNGNSFGLFIVNSNAQELTMTPFPGLQYKTIGGILDIYMVFGNTPQDVINEYWQIIGKPAIPPYWSLGFHLCRWGYNSLNRTKQVVDNMRSNKIPQDTQWNDIDYMSGYKDFTYDQTAYAGLPEFVSDTLHTQYKMKYVNIIDPGIANVNNYKPYSTGISDDIFIKDNDGNVLIGQVWPGTTAYPDFLNPKTQQWWYDQVNEWHNTVNFDGLWIDMNEPSNFVTGSTKGCPSNNRYEDPPYYPRSLDSSTLAEKTVCMTAKQYYNNSQTMCYNTHSLYGFSETVATSYALNQTFGNKRNLIISRSSYPTHGQYGGHWCGDNSANYDDMQLGVNCIIAMNMYGVTMVGTDICGFGGDTTNELCSRWMASGSFYPFMRNHNTNGAKPQDPPSLGEPVISISKFYLNIRYTFIPYLYTLFYKANQFNKVVISGMFYEFYNDINTRDIVDTQFMFGRGIMLIPATTQGQKSVNGYFPDNNRWFNYFGFNEIEKNGYNTIDVTYTDKNGDEVSEDQDYEDIEYVEIFNWLLVNKYYEDKVKNGLSLFNI